MLTPRDIQEVGFAKAVFGGYDMESVDDFLEIVADDYAKLYKDNAVLKSKIKVLVDKIEDYRKTEDSMRMTLLTAQKTSEDLLNRAKTRSTDIVAGAEAEAGAKFAEIERKIYLENERLKKAQQETYEYITKSRKLIQIFSAFLDKIENTELYQDFGEDSSDPALSVKGEESAAHAEAADDDIRVYEPEKPTPEAGDSVTENDKEKSPDEPAGDGNIAEEPSYEEEEIEVPDDVFNDIAEAVQEQLDEDISGNDQSSEPSSEEDAEESETYEDGIESDASEEAKTDENPKDEATLYAETMKLFYDEDEEDSLSPRPKFNFDNLQFGSNYDNKNK